MRGESVNEIELTCSCCLELQDADLPIDLLPVAYDDATWLGKRTKADAHLLAVVSVGCLVNEVRLAKATRQFLTLHGKWEKKVADALHRVMRRMQADVKRRIIDFQSLEPTRILPKGKWWRAARQSVLGPLTQAAYESARETLKEHNRRRLRKQDDLSWSADGDVLIKIPPDAKAAMADGISETMGKDYWMAWEDTTRASVFQTITTGMDAHLNLLQIADSMDDAWAFDYKRAMLVSRTESTNALNSAHNAITHKLIDDPKSIVNGKEWLSIIDNDTRPAHRSANGQRVLRLANGAWVVQDASGAQIGTGDKFILGNDRARYPGDPDLSPGERCNCVLPNVPVSGTFIGGLKGHYSGEVVEIVTRKGSRATLTINHPVLALTGLVAAGELAKGDSVMCESIDTDGSTTRRDDNKQHAPPTAKQLFDSFRASGAYRTISPRSLDLDGDERFFVGYVKRPSSYSDLMVKRKSGISQSFEHRLFVVSDWSNKLTMRLTFGNTFGRVMITPPSGPCLGELPFRSFLPRSTSPLDHLSLATRARRQTETLKRKVNSGPGDTKHFRHTQDADAFSVQLADEVVIYASPESRRFGHAAEWDVMLPKPPIDSVAGNTDLYGKFLHRLAGKVSFDVVVKIRRFHWSGSVYDFETPTSYFAAGGIAIRNCRCTTASLFEGELDERAAATEEAAVEVAPEPILPEAPLPFSPSTRPTPKPSLRQLLPEPKPTPQPEQQLANAISAGEKQLQGRTTERVLAYGPDGAVRVDKVGAIDHVNLTASDIKSMKGSVTMHNHPHNSSFSLDDIRGGILREEAETRVVASKYRFIANYDDIAGLNSKERQELINKIKRTHNAKVKFHAKQMSSKIKSGEITMQDAVDDVSHRSWEFVAKKHGFSYRREQLLP